MNVDDGINDTSHVLICTSLIGARFNQKKGGTIIEIGAPGNVIEKLLDGRQQAILILIDTKEFKSTETALDGHQGDVS